jgi:anti-sigma B factor antagonist
VLLNFADLDDMNSSGVGLLVTLLVRAKRQGQRLAAFGLSEHHREILRVARLDEAIKVYDDETRAVSAS